jgi:Ras-related protein Rab-3D
MTQTNAGGSAKDAADQNFDYMFKLLIIGNSSVGKTSFVCDIFFSCKIIF